jgi:hypothetical protein
MQSILTIDGFAHQKWLNWNYRNIAKLQNLKRGVTSTANLSATIWISGKFKRGHTKYKRVLRTPKLRDRLVLESPALREQVLLGKAADIRTRSDCISEVRTSSVRWRTEHKFKQ